MKKKKVIKLLKKLQQHGCEFCALCETLGQELSECNCLSNKACALHLIELFAADERRKARKTSNELKTY